MNPWLKPSLEPMLVSILKMFLYKEIKRGMVTSDNKNDLPKEAKNFTPQVAIMNHPCVIHSGYCSVLDCYTSYIA
jgi:elongation factor 1-alpha